MHCWCLGIHQAFLGPALWAVLQGQTFGESGSKESRAIKGMKQLNSCLTHWYSEFAARRPEVVLTRAPDLTLDILGGSSDSAQLKLKAHETLGILRFADEKFPTWSHSFHNGHLWSRGAQKLMQMWNILDETEMEVPESHEKACALHRSVHGEGDGSALHRSMGRGMGFNKRLVPNVTTNGLCIFAPAWSLN